MLLTPLKGRSHGRVGASRFKGEVNASLLRNVRRIADVRASDGGGCLFSLQFSPKEDLVAYSTVDHSVRVLDFETKDIVHNLAGHTNIVTCLRWLHYREGLYSSSLDNTIRLWKNGQCVATYDAHSDWLRSLATSPRDDVLLSGCVMSRIFGWDTVTGKVLFKIQNLASEALQSLPPMPAQSDPAGPLNTINVLTFDPTNNNVFLSGARDGVVKLWDRRTLSLSEDVVEDKPVLEIPAHDKKINSAEFGQDGRRILSAARSNAARIHDVRMSGNSPSAKLVKELTGHACAGYGIPAHFLNNDRHVVSGSEDRMAYIYDVDTGEVVSKLGPHPAVVHMVQPLHHSNPPTIVTSSIEETVIHIWAGSTKEEADGDDGERGLGAMTSDDVADGNPALIFLNAHKKVMELILAKYSDVILGLFHSQSLAFQRPPDWHHLQERLGDSIEGLLIRMVNETNADFNTAGILAQRVSATGESFQEVRLPRPLSESFGLPPLNLRALSSLDDLVPILELRQRTRQKTYEDLVLAGHENPLRASIPMDVMP